MAAKSTKKRNIPEGAKAIAENRRARHDFEILDTYECGVMLKGMEVKSLREAKVTLGDAFGIVDKGEVWIRGLHINPYSHASGHEVLDPDRPRKLLLHRNEIDRLAARIAQEGLTLVPLSMYFRNGRAKVVMGLARGKKVRDRRHEIAKRDADREVAKELRRRNR